MVRFWGELANANEFNMIRKNQNILQKYNKNKIQINLLHINILTDRSNVLIFQR